MRFRNIVTLVALLAVSSLLIGCATTISNIDAFKPEQMAKADIMPSEDALTGMKKVVVFALDDSNNGVANQAQMGLSMAGIIEGIIIKGGGVEVVDRKIAEKLQQEIALSEMNQTAAYDGPIIADYAISGNITNAGFSSKFVEATTYKDNKGNIQRTNPSFRYFANVEGTLKLYELPSLRVIKTFQFKDNKSRNEETRSSITHVTRDDELVRGAGSDALEQIRAELLSYFSKCGYVLSKRSKGETYILRISLGKKDGAKEGASSEIYTNNEFTNEITGKKSYERIKICDVKFSNLIDANTSWVYIDKENASRVKLGDEVKMKFSKTSWENMKSVGSAFNSLGQ